MAGPAGGHRVQGAPCGRVPCDRLRRCHGQDARESKQPLQLRILVAVGGVDVDVQPELPGPRVAARAARAEDDGGLRAAEAGAGRPDLDASVVLPAEFDIAEDIAPECGEPLGVGGVNDQLTDTACHARHRT